MSARNALAAQRRANIANLKRALEKCALEKCGNCPELADIKASLNYWVRTDRLARDAEGAAQKSVGLGQYRDFDDVLRALREGPSEAWYEQQRHKLRVINARRVSNRYCGFLHRDAVKNKKSREEVTRITKNATPTMIRHRWYSNRQPPKSCALI